LLLSLSDHYPDTVAQGMSLQPAPLGPAGFRM
jgi:hypothetical protein